MTQGVDVFIFAYAVDLKQGGNLEAAERRYAALFCPQFASARLWLPRSHKQRKV